MAKTRTQREAPVLNVSKNALGVSQYRVEELTSQIESGNLTVGNNYVASNLSKRQLKNNESVAATTDSPEVKRGDWAPANGGVSQITKRGTSSSGTSGSQLSIGAIAHGGAFAKKASVSSSGSGGSSGSNVERLAPEVYSPLFTMANLNLPRDRITVNSWVRNFYKLHPIVRNAINLHATYPISKLNLKCSDRKVLQFFEDMVEEMDLMTTLGDVSLEYWLMGEASLPDSLVTMRDGSVKKIQDVIVGDYVLTHTGNFCKVVKTNSREWDDEYYEMKISGNNLKLQLTGEHPVLSQGMDTISCSVNAWDKKGVKCFPGKNKCKSCSDICKDSPKFKLGWTDTKNLKQGDIVLRPKINEIIDVENIGTFKLSKELCKVIGYYASEGCFYHNGIAFFNTDHELIKDYINCCDILNIEYNISEMSPSKDIVSEKICYCVHSKDENFINFILDNIPGGHSYEKKFSEKIMFLPPQFQKNIIESFIEGDGWVEKTRMSLSTTSVSLANQFSIMFNRLGVSSNFKKRSKIYDHEYCGRRIANKHSIYYIQTKLDKKLNFEFLTKNKNKFDGFVKDVFANRQFNDGEGTFSKITKIEKKKYKGLVYDLSVEKDHSYILNGVAVHNCFPFAELSEKTGKWKQISLQNPDYILVKKSVLAAEPIILLRPDKKVQELVMSNNPADMQLRKQIPEQMLYHIRKGQSIPLDNFNVTHLKMLSAPYDVYGTSILVSIFKDLMLYDKLRECKFAQADGMVNPITIVKVGGSTDGDYRATQEDIEYFRQMFEEAQYDKDFKLITHAGVDVVRVGAQGSVLEIAQDLELIVKNIYTGLMVPQAVVDQESAVYASASIGLEVLRQRYFNFRTVMAKWLTKKIFAPISEIQNFYEYKNGEKKLIVPEVEWNQLNLYDLQDYITNITGLVSTKQASLQTLYRSLGLNYEEERIRMRQESIHGAIRMREEESLSKMTLTELRGLDPEKEIMDPVDDKERAAEAMPPDAAGGGEMPGGMPGMDMGGGGGGGGMPGGLPELAPPPAMELGGGGGGGAPGGAPGGEPGGAPPTV